MNIQLYEGIKYYLNNQRFPANIDEKLKKEISNKHQDYEIYLDRLYFTKNNKRRIVIRIDKLENILYEAHSNGGHWDVNTTFNKVKDIYYWPRMYKIVEEHVKSCDACQRKGKPRAREPLHPITANRPFELVGIDCVGPLPITEKNNRYIIVLTDYKTKWPEAKAVSNIKAATIAEFIYEVIARHGTPEKILSDQGSSFNNELVDSLCELLGTKHILASAYHPQANGLTERFNKTLCDLLDKFMKEGKKEWDYYIDAALYAYRTKPHASTKFTPAMMLYARELATPASIQRKLERRGLNEEEELYRTTEEHVEVITTQLKNIREKARENQERAQERQKRNYDKRIKEGKFKEGQKVLLYDKSKENAPKFEEKWKGPYIIHQVEDNGTCILKNDQGQIYGSVSNSRLKEYFDRPSWVPQVIVESDCVEKRRKLTERIQKEKDTREGNSPKTKTTNRKTREAHVTRKGNTGNDQQQIREPTKSKKRTDKQKVIQRKTEDRRQPDTKIRQETEEELRKMKQLEQQIKERQDQRRNAELREERLKERIKTREKIHEQRLMETLRKQRPLRLITRKDREEID